MVLAMLSRAARRCSMLSLPFWSDGMDYGDNRPVGLDPPNPAASRSLNLAANLSSPQPRHRTPRKGL
jgi:hypothetical protein